MQSINIIRDAMLTVTDKVYHYFAHSEKGNYIVWAEEGQSGSVWADDHCDQLIVTGTVDYFTRKNKDAVVEEIQQALNNCGAVWRFNSVQYEKDTGYIHYEWVWEVGEHV